MTASEPEARTRAKLKMAELVQLTGVPKSTILFYLQEGLLPEPERPKPNVALYDPVCVDLIQYIRGAQEIHRYPVKWIEANIKNIIDGVPPENFIHLGRRILRDATKVHTKAEVLAATGVAEEDLDKYIEEGLVFPMPDGEHFDDYDVKQVELLAGVQRAGIPPEAFQEAAEAIRQFDLATQRLARKWVPRPVDVSLAAQLVDLFSHLQPYLIHRYMERRTPM